MQEPIRYYITKTGDEPTVRSVKVALESPERDERADTVAETQPALSPAPRTMLRPAGVKRLVKSAIKRRPPDA
jgi:hypothetical protein